jgi:hypothetical protein
VIVRRMLAAGLIPAATLLAAPRALPPSAPACDASYPDYCIPPPPPDLNCPQIHGRKPFRVRQPDPHQFDRDHDGWGCEPRPRRRS